MSKETARITTSVLLPIATFIIGGWLVPKMEWIPNIVKIWIFAIGIGLAIFALLMTSSSQNVIGKWIPKRNWMLLSIVLLSICIIIAAGVFLTTQSNRYETREKLQTSTQILINEITQFVADRALSHPYATDNWNSADEWFQKSRDYDMNTNNLFVSRYRQRIIEVVDEMFKLDIITEDEAKHIKWNIQPEYPVIPWALEALEKYRAKLR